MNELQDLAMLLVIETIDESLSRCDFAFVPG
jgi:hypothetical protein